MILCSTYMYIVRLLLDSYMTAFCLIFSFFFLFFFFSSRRRHTRLVSDWSSDVCSSDLITYKWLPTHCLYSEEGPGEPNWLVAPRSRGPFGWMETRTGPFRPWPRRNGSASISS